MLIIVKFANCGEEVNVYLNLLFIFLELIIHFELIDIGWFHLSFIITLILSIFFFCKFNYIIVSTKNEKWRSINVCFTSLATGFEPFNYNFLFFIYLFYNIRDCDLCV